MKHRKERQFLISALVVLLMSVGVMSFTHLEEPAAASGLGSKLSVREAAIAIAADPCALSGWAYRVSVTVNNGGAALTDHFVLLTLNTSSLISGGKLRADGGDLRLTDANCNLINFWIESGLNTTSTKIWVKVPTLAAGASELKIFYGNPAATRTNQASDVFGANLVTLFTFTEGAGAILHDWVGGNDLNVTATWTTGPRPGVNALTAFDTGRAFRSSNGPSLGSGSFTVIDVIFATSLNGKTQGIIGNYNSDGASGWIHKQQGDPGQHMSLTNQSGNWCQDSRNGIVANVWQSLGMRRVNTGNNLFANGAIVGAAMCGGDNRNVNNSGPFEIGRGYNGTTSYAFAGSISFSAIYNTNLTDAQMQALHNSLLANPEPTTALGAEELSIICPTITITTSLPGGIVGAPYSQTLSASGGTPGYTFNVTSGALPSGLSLSNGTISGTLTASGTFGFTITATDANGCTGSRAYSVTINCPTISLTPTSLPLGIVDHAYSQTLTPSGGTAPYVFVVTGLPSGLTVSATSSNVSLSGTPTQTGSFTVNVTITDGYGCTGSQNYTLVINALQQLPGDVRLSADFDGDGKSDLAIWRPSTATFWVFTSATTTTLTKQLGVSTDVPVPRDYDGDGKTDFAVWRPSTGIWMICQSTTGATVTGQWGASTDIPVPGDYDGDGKADLAIWRPSTGVWWIYKSSNGATINVQWGAVGDVPVPGDYDGDGKTDLAWWRASTATFWIYSIASNTVTTKQWGVSTDLPVPSDYDGDGKTDVAVWRPATATWIICQSTNGATTGGQWGSGTDVPVPGDYDGDGKADLGVWRPSNGMWMIYKSSNGGTISAQWGMLGDVPMS